MAIVCSNLHHNNLLFLRVMSTMIYLMHMIRGLELDTIIVLMMKHCRVMTVAEGEVKVMALGQFNSVPCM